MPAPRPRTDHDGTDAARTNAGATGLRTGGAALAAGSALLVVGIANHPPPSPDPAAFAATIAEAPVRWQAAHVATAIALFALAVAGLVVLTAGSRLTRHWSTRAAWAVLVVGALWVTTAAVAEATVVTRAAVAGDVAAFETWQLFAEAHSAAFVALAAAFAVIAGREARSAAAATPGWAAGVAALAALVAAVAYAAGVGLGVGLAGPVWLVSTIVMGLWSVWFGVALARSAGPAPSSAGETDASGRETVP